MSTILKALRRLEEDRNAGPGRPLREAVTRGGDGERKGRGAWLLASALGLGVGLAASGGAYWFVSQQGATEPGAPVAVAPHSEPLPRAEVAHDSEPSPRAEIASDPARAGAVPGEAAPTPSVSEASDPGPPSVLAAAEPPERRQELSPAALTSPVERVERPMPEPRIAADDQDDEPLVLGSANRTQPRSALGRERPSSRTAAATSRNVQPAPAAAPSEVDPWEQAAAEDASKRDQVPPVVALTPDAASLSREMPTPKPVVEPALAAVSSADPQPTPPAVPSADPQPTSPVASEPKPVAAARPESASKQEKPPAPSGTTTVARAAVPGVRVEKTFWHPSAERRTALIEVDGGVEEIQEGDAVGPLVVSTIEPSGVVFQHEGIEIRRRVGE